MQWAGRLYMEDQWRELCWFLPCRSASDKLSVSDVQLCWEVLLQEVWIIIQEKLWPMHWLTQDSDVVKDSHLTAHIKYSYEVRKCDCWFSRIAGNWLVILVIWSSSVMFGCEAVIMNSHVPGQNPEHAQRHESLVSLLASCMALANR